MPLRRGTDCKAPASFTKWGMFLQPRLLHKFYITKVMKDKKKRLENGTPVMLREPLEAPDVLKLLYFVMYFSPQLTT